MYETQALGGGVSSGRDHAVGGEAPSLGIEVALKTAVGAFTTGARRAGGAEFAQPMPAGQDGHVGPFPSGAVQQSVARIVGVAFADGLSADVRLLA